MKSTSTIIAFLAGLSFALAQVSTVFQSSELIESSGKFNKAYKNKTPWVLPPEDIGALLAADSADNTSNGPKLFKIAKAVPLNIDVVKAADWIEDGDFAYGKFTIVAPGAKSISVNFERFFLPIGSELYVYNKNGQMITGPATEIQNSVFGWRSWVYMGAEVNVELRYQQNYLIN